MSCSFHSRTQDHHQLITHYNMATEILNVFPGLEVERLLRRVKFRHDDPYLLDTAEHEVRPGCEIFQAGPGSNKTFSTSSPSMQQSGYRLTRKKERYCQIFDDKTP